MIFDPSLVPKCSKSCWFHINYPKRVWTCIYDSIYLPIYTQLAICRQLQKDNKEKVGKPRSGKKPSGKARPQKGNARGSKKDRNSKKPKKGLSNKTKTPKGKTTEPPASPAKTPEQPVKKKLRSKRHDNWAATIWRAILGCHFWNFRLHFRALVFYIYGNKAQIKFAKYHESKIYRLSFYFSPYSGCDLGTKQHVLITCGLNKVPCMQTCMWKDSRSDVYSSGAVA